MYNVDKVYNGLDGLVGFNNPYDPQFQILEPDLLVSRSGRKINENPYCTIEKIKSTQDYEEITDADFNEYLRTNIRSSIAEVMDEVFIRSDYIDRQIVYQYAQNKVDTDDLPDGFVGFRILVSNTKNVAFEITRAILDFDATAPGEDIELLLFASGKKDPIYTQTVTVDSDSVIADLNWVVDNTQGIYKGEFYLGYLTQGLTIKPFKRDYNASNIISSISEMYMEEVKVDNWNVPTLFDLTQYKGLSTAHGINLDITVYEDNTDMILNNQTLFARAVQYACWIKFMSTYIATLRSNRTQRNLERDIDTILSRIDGREGDDGRVRPGYRAMLTSSIKQIRSEIEKLKDGYFTDGKIANIVLS